MGKQFLVPVLIQVKTEGVDYKDAASIAERAVQGAILDASDFETEGKPTITFVSDAHVYASDVLSVMELNRALRNGTAPLFLYGKMRE